MVAYPEIVRASTATSGLAVILSERRDLPETTSQPKKHAQSGICDNPKMPKCNYRTFAPDCLCAGRTLCP